MKQSLENRVRIPPKTNLQERRLNSSKTNNENDHLNGEPSTFADLLLRARSGNSEAIGELIERHRKYLLLIANQGISGNLRTKIGASDAVQESMLLAAEKFGQFRGGLEQEFKTWLKTILANDIRKANRHFATDKRNANREINLQDQSAVGHELLDEELTPSSAAIEQEKARALTSVLAQLTPMQRQVIRLRNFEKLSFADIGQRIDKSEDAARKLWARTIETIKRRLDSKNDNSGCSY